MIDKEAAKRLATDYVKRDSRFTDEVIILDQFTIEKPYGWVFFYDSKRYVETKDIGFALAGNGPLIVEKLDGSLHVLGTALPVEDSLREFESMKRKTEEGARRER